MDLGLGEIVFILVIVLLLYGERLPEVARNLGKTLYDLKKSFNEAKQELINPVRSAIKDSVAKDIIPDDTSGGVKRPPETPESQPEPDQKTPPESSSESEKSPYPNNDALSG